MKYVDGLSRYPVMFIKTEDGTVNRIRKAQEEDEEMPAIKEILKDKSYKDYMIKDQLLYKILEASELLVIPKNMQSWFIRAAHNNGHFSVKNTKEIIKQNYHIPALRQKIERIISCCITCILINRKCRKQEWFLHPLQKGGGPLYTYHVDHIGPLEFTNKNYLHVFVIIDSFTKFTLLYPTKSTGSAEVTKKLEQPKEIFRSPAVIISDRGTAFASKEFVEYCKRENIQQITVGLPRSNDQVERINSMIARRHLNY